MRARIEAMITRAKIKAARVAGRTLLQLAALDNEVYDSVELLLPPGYVANPAPSNTADPLILQNNAQGSHKVALGGDDTADAVPDLAAGEYGLSNGARRQRIILRVNHTELIATLLVWAATPDGPFQRLVQEQFVALYNAHTHSGGAPPDHPMDHTHLTGGS